MRKADPEQKTKRTAGKSPKGRKPAAAKETSKRTESKTSQIITLLKRTGGATTAELLKVTGWQAHSLRGFLSGTLRKKMELELTSTKAEDGERSYSLKA